MTSRLSIPIKVGLLFGSIGIILTVIGIIRGNVPPNPASIAVALLIGGSVWYLVSWAVAAAAVDVENDVAAAGEVSQEVNSQEVNSQEVNSQEVNSQEVNSE